MILGTIHVILGEIVFHDYVYDAENSVFYYTEVAFEKTREKKKKKREEFSVYKKPIIKADSKCYAGDFGKITAKMEIIKKSELSEFCLTLSAINMQNWSRYMEKHKLSYLITQLEHKHLLPASTSSTKGVDSSLLHKMGTQVAYKILPSSPLFTPLSAHGTLNPHPTPSHADLSKSQYSHSQKAHSTTSLLPSPHKDVSQIHNTLQGKLTQSGFKLTPSHTITNALFSIGVNQFRKFHFNSPNSPSQFSQAICVAPSLIAQIINFTKKMHVIYRIFSPQNNSNYDRIFTYTEVSAQCRIPFPLLKNRFMAFGQRILHSYKGFMLINYFLHANHLQLNHAQANNEEQ